MATRTRRPLSEQQREQRRAQERELMAQAVETLLSSEGWQRWLTVRRHFRSYSLHNQLLIALQCPHATRVAGFRAWMKLGYVPRKGSRAIRIWAPMAPSKRQLEQWRNDGANPDTRPRTFFKLAAVFDASQVDPIADFPGGPAPLSAPIGEITGEQLADYWPALIALGRQIGSSVELEEIPGPADGFYEPRTRRIVIDNRLAANRRVATAVHELAHALMAIEKATGDFTLEYATEEMLVETVAYCVCSGLGVDTSANSVPYVAAYSRNLGAETIQRHAQLIDQIARRIEDAIHPAAQPSPSA